MTNPEEKLRPCPFCGVKISLAYGKNEVFIKCNCKNFFESDEEAIKWFRSAHCWKLLDEKERKIMFLKGVLMAIREHEEKGEFKLSNTWHMANKALFDIESSLFKSSDQSKNSEEKK